MHGSHQFTTSKLRDGSISQAGIVVAHILSVNVRQFIIQSFAALLYSVLYEYGYWTTGTSMATWYAPTHLDIKLIHELL